MNIKTNIILAFNFLFSPILVIFFVLSKNFEIASYFGLISSIIIFITQSLSANKRQIIILGNKTSIISKTITQRIVFSLFIVFVSYLYLFHINNIANSKIIFLLIIYICFFWIKEIIITELEIRKKNKDINIEFFVYLIFYLSIILQIFILKNNENLLIFFILYLFIFILLVFNKLKEIKEKNYSHSFPEFFQINIYYFSSFSIIFCNLLWRVCIFIFTNDIKAGIIYAAFSFGSFSSTIFVNTFGSHLVKDKKLNKDISKYFINYFFISMIFLILINLTFFETFLGFEKLFIDTLTYSIFGSIFMLIGQYKRQNMILRNIKLKKKDIFIFDIIYSFLLFMVVPITFYTGGEKFLIMSFLFGSILCFIFYGILENIEKKIS